MIDARADKRSLSLRERDRERVWILRIHAEGEHSQRCFWRLLRFFDSRPRAAHGERPTERAETRDGCLVEAREASIDEARSDFALELPKLYYNELL